MAVNRATRSAAVLLAAILCVCILTLAPMPAWHSAIPVAQAHPIAVDGLTGDWCAPALYAGMAPDTFLTFAPPVCLLGTETIWADLSAPPDTIGYVIGGGWGVPPYPAPPMPDPEVNLRYLAVSDDCGALYFLIELGSFPTTGGTPPIVEIAIDVPPVVVPPAGGTMWYDPAMGMPQAPLVGAAGGFQWEYLITTDFVANTAWVWTPGFAAPPVPVPMAAVPGPMPNPTVIEIAVPWPVIGGQPPLGVPYHFTAMTAHSVPGPMGVTSAPMTDPDDVITNVGGGNSTALELIPDRSVDFLFFHTISDCVPPTAIPTDTATQTASPTHTATPTTTRLPTATPTPTLTPSRTPTISPTPTLTPSRTPTFSPTPTLTPSSTPTASPTPTLTPSRTPTPSATSTSTPTPTATPLSTSTSTPTPTATPSLSFEICLPAAFYNALSP